ncbi:hypothetical protein DFJ74DRAFT_293424 [Hyaloraphidium curvatum]|nr:hypothetical protein DFJ74DRAFT_293424 [Hyaloraphidium curvatum]
MTSNAVLTRTLPFGRPSASRSSTPGGAAKGRRVQSAVAPSTDGSDGSRRDRRSWQSEEPDEEPKTFLQAARESWASSKPRATVTVRAGGRSDESGDEESNIPKPFDTRLTRVSLRGLPQYLHDLDQDFRPVRGVQLMSAKVHQFLVTSDGGPAGKLDPRAVILNVEQNPAATRKSVERAIRKQRPVYRYIMECVGTSACPAPGVKCPMLLGVFIFAHDIQHAVVFTRNFHDPPNEERRRTASMLRTLAFDYFLRSGSTPAQFILDEGGNLSKLGGIPEGTLKSIARQARKAKFGPVSLNVLRKLARDRPTNVQLLGLADDGEDIGCDFSYAFTDTVGLVFAILYSIVVGIDTSWRRKNAQGFPLTGLVAFDLFGRRARPLAFLFSTNIKRPTLKRFLKWFVARVQSFCRDLLASPDESGWPAELRGYRELVQRTATTGWRPRCMTLDKSYAELGALQDVFGIGLGTVYRLCYYHIKEAFMRRAGKSKDGKRGRRDGEAGEEDAIPDSVIPRGVRTASFFAFRDLCAKAHNDEQWENGKKELLEKTIPDLLERNATDHTAEMCRQISQCQTAYVQKDWLNDTWTPLVADYLLPSDLDVGDCFTNNHTEVIWKVIDNVILCGNFHIATAIVKLDRIWLYSKLTDDRGHMHPKVAEALELGTELWVKGHVRLSEGEIYGVRCGDGSRARVDLSAPRRWCDVPACRVGSNPHRCKHWFAADLMRHNGTFAEWEEESRRDFDFELSIVQIDEEVAGVEVEQQDEPMDLQEPQAGIGEEQMEPEAPEAPEQWRDNPSLGDHDLDGADGVDDQASIDLPPPIDFGNRSTSPPPPKAALPTPSPAPEEDVDDDDGNLTVQSNTSRQPRGRPPKKAPPLRPNRRNYGIVDSSDDDAPLGEERPPARRTVKITHLPGTQRAKQLGVEKSRTKQATTTSNSNSKKRKRELAQQPARPPPTPPTLLASPVKHKRTAYSAEPSLTSSTNQWADAFAVLLPALYRVLRRSEKRGVIPPRLLSIVERDAGTKSSFDDYADHGYVFPPEHDLNFVRDWVATETLRKIGASASTGGAVELILEFLGSSFSAGAKCECEPSTPSRLTFRDLPMIRITTTGFAATGSAAAKEQLWQSALHTAWQGLFPGTR